MTSTRRLIHVGFACSNRCLFCAQGDLRDRSLECITNEELRSIRMGDWVAFVGGEPTDFPELPDWIRSARQRGAASVVVQSNGRRLANDDVASVLRDAGTTSLDVSIAGSSAAMHDYHTQRPGSFEQTRCGLTAASAAGLPFALTCVVTRSNYRHLGEIVALAADVGARAIHFAMARPLGRLRPGHSLIPPAVLAAPHLVAALREAQRRQIPVVTGGHPSDPRAVEHFAGIGLVEPSK